MHGEHRIGFISEGLGKTSTTRTNRKFYHAFAWNKHLTGHNRLTNNSKHYAL